MVIFSHAKISSVKRIVLFRLSLTVGDSRKMSAQGNGIVNPHECANGNLDR